MNRKSLLGKNNNLNVILLVLSGLNFDSNTITFDILFVYKQIFFFLKKIIYYINKNN